MVTPDVGALSAAFPVFATDPDLLVIVGHEASANRMAAAVAQVFAA
jgi:hypothetical protein